MHQLLYASGLPYDQTFLLCVAVLQRVNNSITVTNALNFVYPSINPYISITVHIFGIEYYNFGIKEES